MRKRCRPKTEKKKLFTQFYAKISFLSINWRAILAEHQTHTFWRWSHIVRKTYRNALCSPMGQCNAVTFGIWQMACSWLVACRTSTWKFHTYGQIPLFTSHIRHWPCNAKLANAKQIRMNETALKAFSAQNTMLYVIDQHQPITAHRTEQPKRCFCEDNELWKTFN